MSISNLLIICACSSTMLHSPMMIGPASAIMEALGCTTVMLPIVISPRNSHSLHTTAPGAIFTLELNNLHLHQNYTKVICWKVQDVSMIKVTCLQKIFTIHLRIIRKTWFIVPLRHFAEPNSYPIHIC